LGFVHYTLVGHFDPRTVFTEGVRNLAVSRPVDGKKAEALLGEYPSVVATQVRVQDGYVRCQWAPSTHGDEIVEYAYRLARVLGCLAVENGREVTFPPDAARAQADVWERTVGPPGLAREREAHARQAAQAFEEKMRRRAEGQSDRFVHAREAIAKRRLSHAQRGGCFVVDDAGQPTEDAVRETLASCDGDHALTESLLNRRFLFADALDHVAPGETFSAREIGELAQALAAAVRAQLGEQFPGRAFDVEVTGAQLAEEEPLEVCVTFHRASPI
jgi:hypothetical protein